MIEDLYGDEAGNIRESFEDVLMQIASEKEGEEPNFKNEFTLHHGLPSHIKIKHIRRSKKEDDAAKLTIKEYRAILITLRDYFGINVDIP